MMLSTFKTKRFLILLICLLFTGQSFANNSFRIWTAFRGSGKFITSYDVQEYICALHLSDEAMIEMFKEAGGDYDKYQNLRAQWAKRRFKSGLRQISYVQAIQTHARTSFDRDDIKAFKVTESSFFKRTQELEDKAVKQWLDQGLGIVKGRIEFAKKLIALGYPHKENQDLTELYFEWFELQKKRLKEKIRLDEVQKYEYARALGYQREFYARPVEIFDFEKEMTAFINDKIEGKRLTPLELANIVSGDERIPVMAKSIELLGPSTLNLKQLSEQAPEVFSDFRQELEKVELSLESMNRYFKAAQTLAQTKAKGELNQMAEEARKRFLLTDNDYTELMKAKIFELAIVLNQGSAIDQNTISQYLEELMTGATEVLDHALDNPQDIKMRIEDHLVSEISQYRDNFKGLNEATAEAITLSNWVLKFQVKKVSLGIKPVAKAELIDNKTWQGQKRIANYIKGQQYKTNLDEFRRGKLTRVGHYITISPDGNEYLTDSQAWEYVLDQF